MTIKDYEPVIVDLDDVPVRGDQGRFNWKQRFLELSDGKAVMVRYNNRQRAHQVRALIIHSARYWGFKNIRTRVIHAEPAIHGTDGWLLYWWKDNSNEIK